jgi:hypothetical protein
VDNRQLQWARDNRLHRHRDEPLSTIVKRLQQRAPLKVPAWRAQIAGVLADLADETLTGHAWLGGFRGGVLTVFVDDPGLVSALRMRWHRPLIDTLIRRLPQLGVVDVRFRLAAAPQASSIRSDRIGAVRNTKM